MYRERERDRDIYTYTPYVYIYIYVVSDRVDLAARRSELRTGLDSNGKMNPTPCWHEILCAIRVINRRRCPNTNL